MSIGCERASGFLKNGRLALLPVSAVVAIEAMPRLSVTFEEMASTPGHAGIWGVPTEAEAGIPPSLLIALRQSVVEVHDVPP